MVAEVDPRGWSGSAQPARERDRPRRGQAGADQDARRRRRRGGHVRDQGVGLRPGEEKLVFNRFWRSDPRGCGVPVAPDWAWRSASRTRTCTRAGWKLGASPATGLLPVVLPLVRGRKVTTSPLPMEPIAPERKERPGFGRVSTRSGACDAAANRAALSLALVLAGLRRVYRARRRHRPSAPSSARHRRTCPSRRPAWIPTSCCANSSRPPPIRPTGTWRRGSS